jgi:hypothetical protein
MSDHPALCQSHYKLVPRVPNHSSDLNPKFSIAVAIVKCLRGAGLCSFTAAECYDGNSKEDNKKARNSRASVHFTRLCEPDRRDRELRG